MVPYKRLPISAAGIMLSPDSDGWRLKSLFSAENRQNLIMADRQSSGKTPPTIDCSSFALLPLFDCFIFIYLLRGSICMPQSAYGGQRTTAGFWSLLSPCKSQGPSDLGHQAWQQMPLATEPSCCPAYSAVLENTDSMVYF